MESVVSRYNIIIRPSRNTTLTKCLFIMFFYKFKLLITTLEVHCHGAVQTFFIE